MIVGKSDDVGIHSTSGLSRALERLARPFADAKAGRAALLRMEQTGGGADPEMSEPVRGESGEHVLEQVRSELEQARAELAAKTARLEVAERERASWAARAEERAQHIDTLKMALRALTAPASSRAEPQTVESAPVVRSSAVDDTPESAPDSEVSVRRGDPASLSEAASEPPVVHVSGHLKSSALSPDLAPDGDDSAWAAEHTHRYWFQWWRK